VTIYDSGRADGLYFFLMEFVDGVTLRQLLGNGRIAPREALAIVPQICDALQYAHDQGIVHRDIKPENILLDRRGRVKVADFGLAKLMGTESEAPGENAAAGSATLTEAGKVMGTPNYMAPEQFSHPQEVDHRADIYSLGVVFYQMLTGELPGKRLERPSKKVRVDVRLDEIVLRALDQQPERRYQQASTLKTHVETLSGEPADSPSSADSPPVAPSSPPSPRLSRTAVVGFCCSFLLILAAPFLLIGLKMGHGGSSPDGSFPVWFGLITTLLVVLPGIISVLGTTILGAVAIGQIRRSAGRLYGFGLALFDALVFPLLLLSWFIIRMGFGFGLKVSVSIILVLFIDAFLVWCAWYLLRPISPSGTAPLRSTGRKITAAVAALLLVGIIFANLFAHLDRELPQLAHRPDLLRQLPNAELINVGVAEPDSPWAWQELQRRAQSGRLSSSEANKLLDDLTAHFRREYPGGYDKPLNWFVELSKDLSNRDLVSEEHVLRFLDAVNAGLEIETLPRLRETADQLHLSCRWRSVWHHNLFGLVLLNEMRAVSLNGQPLSPLYQTAEGRSWKSHMFIGNYKLPALSPGRHTIRCEVESAFIPETDLAGLPANVPATDWPPARRRWTRFAEAELRVYGQDAQLVSLTEDPELDPVAFGGLAVQRALVRSKGNRATVVIVLNLDGDFRVPISFDATLKVDDQTYPLGTVWCEKRPNGHTYSGRELSVDIDSLNPQVKEAEIVLTPNPRSIEHLPTVQRIWGKPVVFRQIPLTRQDLYK
jgi:hypothetical protein